MGPHYLQRNMSFRLSSLGNDRLRILLIGVVKFLTLSVIYVPGDFA